MMELDHVLHGDQMLLYMERYVDEGTRSYSPFAAKSEVAPEFQPRTGRSSFELISVCAPKSRVTVFEAEPQCRLRDFYIQPNDVRFLVHPETWASSHTEHLDELQALRRIESLEVAPTASTRTVLTTQTPGDVPHHFVKLHYPLRISRFNRRLKRKNIQNSVAATRDLVHVALEKFAYLPDTLGFVFGDDDNAWGFLVREATPRPVRERRFLIPFFALYGGDLKRPDDPPLLRQLIDRLGAEPQLFVIEQIMIPVVECWAKAIRERGILLESHGQNILLEVDQNFQPTRIVHRDCDVWIDGDARRNAGLDDAFLQISVGDDTPFPREQHYSLVYDHFIGRELLDYLLKSLTRFYAVKEHIVRGCVADAFRQLFPDARDFFPADTTFYFSNEILPGNEFRLVDMEQCPQWR